MTKPAHIALCLVAWVLVAAASPAWAQFGTPAHPQFRLLAGFMNVRYWDHSKNQSKVREEDSGITELSGTEVQVAGSYQDYEVELDSRTLTPKGTATDWWTKRNELYLTTSYYWPMFPFVQPVLGYHQMSQQGDRDHEEAPPAFIKKNTALIFGLRSSIVAWSFGTHGILAQARMSYLTSLEKGKNFGDEGYAGLGYYFQTGGFKAALVFGQARNFYNASVPDPEDEALLLQVRHWYWGNRFGLYLEY